MFLLDWCLLFCHKIRDIQNKLILKVGRSEIQIIFLLNFFIMKKRLNILVTRQGKKKRTARSWHSLWCAAVAWDSSWSHFVISTFQIAFNSINCCVSWEMSSYLYSWIYWNQTIMSLSLFFFIISSILISILVKQKCKNLLEKEIHREELGSAFSNEIRKIY